MQRSREILAVACATLLCGLVLSGCGGGTSGDTGGGGGTGGTNGSGTVGAGGGTVSLPSGPAVVVPTGSLPANTTITVAASTGAAPAGAIGSVYEFGPSGTTFANPVTVRFPVPAGTVASTIAIYWTKPGSTTQWDTLTATVSGTTATASVTHFSQGYVGFLPNQCIDLTGAWTFTQHCASNYLGKQLVITQAGCTISTTEPVTGQPLTGTVVGNTFEAGPCPATVTGDTMSIQCSGCPQIAVRQACTAGLTCAPSGTADPCKNYATTCGAGGASTCGVSGNKADGTTCGSGLTCSAGTCTGSGGTLIGTWSGNRGGVSGTLVFNVNGTFTGDNAATAGVDVTGSYQVAGSQLTVVDTGGPQACPQSQVGLYGYGVSPSTLTITLVSDACVGRSLSFPGTYSRGPLACVAGQACTPSGTADPCKTYVSSCDAAGNLTCGAGGNKTDGATCGGTNYCTAGVCSRTVNIANGTTYWSDSAKTEVPRPGQKIWLNHSSPSGAVRLPAVSSVVGGSTYAIPNVPVGPYFIEVRANGGTAAPIYWYALLDAVDMGTDSWGRADATLASTSTPVTLNFTNLTPWGTSHDIEFFSSNAGMTNYGFGPFGTAAPWAAGSTTATGVDEYFNTYSTLLDPAKGDTTYFAQLATRAASAGGVTYPYVSVDKYFLTSAFGVSDGVPSSFSVPFVSPPSTTSIPADWRLSEFAAFKNEVNPGASGTQAQFYVEAQPHLSSAAQYPVPVNSAGGWPDLLVMQLSGVDVDLNLGTVQYGDFLSTPWGAFRWTEYLVDVSMTATGATVPYVRARGLGSIEAVQGASSPIRPAISPPRSPRINGTDAFAATTGVTTTPTFSWSAPALSTGIGTNTHYAVLLFSLGNSSGRTTSTWVGSVADLTDTQVQIPAGLLQAGKQYYAEIAVDTGPGVAHFTPRRVGLPRAWAFTITGIFSP